MNLWMGAYAFSIQVKDSEQYFPVVLFIMLYEMIVTFETVD